MASRTTSPKLTQEQLARQQIDRSDRPRHLPAQEQVPRHQRRPPGAGHAGTGDRGQPPYGVGTVLEHCGGVE